MDDVIEVPLVKPEPEAVSGNDAVTVIPKDAFANSKVGDVIQIKGRFIPPMFWDKWFRLEAIDDDGNVTLSKPYVDSDLKQPYVWNGTGKGSALALERRSRHHR